MVSLERFEAAVLAGDGIVLCMSGRILCGCGLAFPSLAALQCHITKVHSKRNGVSKVEGLRSAFQAGFVFPEDDARKAKNIKTEEEDEEVEEVKVLLPTGITCVCLNEHDIGAFAGPTACHKCPQECPDLESLNKHMSEVHRQSQVLVGQNIVFERLTTSPPLPPAFFCPMVRCKYHIAESDQRNHFKTFKLLKQHYVKVHAAKTLPCPNCQQKFSSKIYLEVHKKTCGRTFTCTCSATFPRLESLQTHAR